MTTSQINEIITTLQARIESFPVSKWKQARAYRRQIKTLQEQLIVLS